jgi:hypothetical protein
MGLLAVTMIVGIVVCGARIGLAGRPLFGGAGMED